MLRALGAEGAADHAWAMRHALSFLLPIDAARLVVALLEGGSQNGAEDGNDDQDARARVHWLRYGDAPLAPIDDDMLLEMAASHACWRALCVLLEDVRAASPSWVTLLDDDITEVDGLHDTKNVVIRRAITAHRGTHYRFGHNVAKDVATRGDLQAVMWLWPRLAKTSGQVEPTRRSSDGQYEHHARAEVILEAAARARHFQIIEWVVKTSPLVHCVLPYNNELEAVCWIMRKIRYPRWCVYYCATKKYGYHLAESQDTVSVDGMTSARTTRMPLADPFARDGDLDILMKIFARPNYPQLIGWNSIAQAAQSGHLHVVKWLNAILPEHSLPACFVAAARGGHVPILEWMHQELRYSQLPAALVEAGASGHVDVLRWYLSINSGHSPYFEGAALTNAIRNGHLDVVRYLYEERHTRMDANVVVAPLAQCRSIDVFDYVLDRVESLSRRRLLLNGVANQSSLAVVKHLILNRGLWGSDALDAALSRQETASVLEIVQFLYAQAQERAKHLGTPLEDQVYLKNIKVGRVRHISAALWLLENVPEVVVWDRAHARMIDAFPLDESRKLIFLECIKHRPDACLEVPWLPLWAVHTNSFEALELLKQSNHPRVHDIDTFQAVTAHTRDARFMLKLLPLPDDEPKLRHDVVEWAAKYGMVTVLDRVFDHEDDSRIQQQLLKRVAHHVGVSGHVEMADWLVRRCSTLAVSTSTAFKSVSVDTVCHGHVHVLQWLREHDHNQQQQLLPTRPHAIEKLVTEAGNARQVRSLQWLLLHMESEIQPRWITHVLVDAVRQNHAEVVEFITRTFEPEGLPVRGHEMERIRDYLQKIHRGDARGAATATGTQSSANDVATGGRRAKRTRRQ